MKPTYRSWAGILLMFSDLTLGPSFKLKQWFTGFGELSFWWIQICIGSPMRTSSYKLGRKSNLGDWVLPWGPKSNKLNKLGRYSISEIWVLLCNQNVTQCKLDSPTEI